MKDFKQALIILFSAIFLAACDLTPSPNAGTHPVVHHPAKDPTIATPDQVQNQRAETQIEAEEQGEYPTQISDLVKPE